jgi:CheY-like chemotaxis protein
MNLHEARILVVDDEPALREIFTHWLKTFGCVDVRTAADGEAAIAAIEAEPIDLLLTDVRMPIMDGISLVRRLHELQIGVPSIIFVSGFSDVDEREMYGLGVESFLSKPLSRETFAVCLEQAVAARSALWLHPMEIPPRQTLTIDAEVLTASAEAGDSQEDAVFLGRGGFSARSVVPLVLGKISFICRLAATPLGERRTLTGQGYVRWFSRSDYIAGIQFTFLDPACRDWVLDEIARGKPESFIPNLPSRTKEVDLSSASMLLKRVS